MSAPVARYRPARQYHTWALVAFAMAAFSFWCGLRWTPAFLPSMLLLLSSALMLVLATRPTIEVHEEHLRIGRVSIPWGQIRRLDRTGWISPLVLYITLLEDKRLLVIYPGDLESATSLLRQLRRNSREALIDGIPYRQFWGEALTPAPDRAQAAPARYPILRPEDEAEIERMFQRLKTVGHLDPKNSPDE
ncbi:MAG: DUF3093 family protein [Bryobacteraceae bacterium]|nr:DUF3093 family protein [Bryobacteraceae bacterium]